MAIIKKKIIKLSKSSISNLEVNSVKNILYKEYLGMGPEVKKFEETLSKYFGRYVVCVSNGTSAIQLALQAIGLKRGDEVIVPSITYVSTFQAISANGAVPIACDIDPTSLLIDIKDVENRITKKTKAIIPVHYAGDICNLKLLRKITNKYNLYLIEDSAHAFGSMIKGKLLGSHKGISCFSFDGIKNITSGEGGCVVTSNKKILEYIRNARSLGIVAEHKFKYQRNRKWYFDVTHQGWRYHMSDIMASIGISQFHRKKKFFNKRKNLAKNYDHLLRKNHFIEIFKRNYNEIVPHIYPIRIKNFKKIKLLQEKLLELGIETGIHYYPNHKLSFFKYTHFGTPLDNTNKIFNEIITLPLHVDLTQKEQKYIVNNLNFILPKLIR